MAILARVHRPNERDLWGGTPGSVKRSGVRGLERFLISAREWREESAAEVDIMEEILARNQRQSWFLIRLLYATSVDRSGKRMRIEEDLWLFRFSDAEAAYQEAVAGAAAAADLGRALVGGRPSAFLDIGAEEYFCDFFLDGAELCERIAARLVLPKIRDFRRSGISTSSLASGA
jgi:hypothetical protein